MSDEELHKSSEQESVAVLHFDGGAKPNPGKGAYGFVLEYESDTIEGSEFLGESTNNRAEYEGLIAGLTRAIEEDIPRIRVVGDSELLVKQIHGEYDVNNEQLKERYERVLSLKEQFTEFRLEHAPREKNTEADQLVTDVLENQQ